jgi:hypothetical protein
MAFLSKFIIALVLLGGVITLGLYLVQLFGSHFGSKKKGK